MPGVPFLDQLITSIDNRIGELNREITSLQDARSALVANGSAASTTRQTAAVPTRPPRRRARARRKPARKTAVLLAETAERMLAESDGLTTAALAGQAEANHDQVLALLRDLETARRVRRTGQRRSTRWHAITDEDRIAERAAQLAGRRRRRAK